MKYTLFFLFLLLLITSVSATDMYFFYEPNCEECGAMEEFLRGLEKNYPIEVIRKDILQSEAELMSYCDSCDPKDVPILIVNGKIFTKSSNNINTRITREISMCQEILCPPLPAELAEEEVRVQIDRSTLGWVFLVCVFLVAFVLVIPKKKLIA